MGIGKTVAIATLLFIMMPQAQAAIEIHKVGVTPKTIDLSQGEVATFHFETTEDAFVTVSLSDENENPVNVRALGLAPAGIQEIEWDGTTSDGNFVTTDVVLYELEARTESGDTAYVKMARTTGGDKFEDLKFTLDSETRKISYVLPKAARVRLRVGLHEGVLLETRYDWRPEEAGRHEFIWDGVTADGLFKLLDHPSLNLNLNAFSLADNSIIVKGVEVNYDKTDDLFKPLTEGKHYHYPHPRYLCHEPRFEISFPTAHGVTDSGAQSLRGNARIKLVLDPRDAPDLIRKRFEVMFFIDTQFLFEEEHAVNPAMFYLDTTLLTPGDHLLSVSVMSYDDHIATKSIKVHIES